MTKNERPGFLARVPLPLLGLAIAVAIVGVVVLAMRIGSALAPKADEDFQLDRGTCSSTSMTAQSDFTLTNLTGEAIRVKVDIEYRDLDGRLIDSDKARIEIGPHDSVRHREATIVGSNATLIRSCPIVSVDASWSDASWS